MTPRARRLLLAVLVAAQATTLAITWPLWQARTAPPNLPLLPGLPAWNMGAALLATLALVLVAPRWGIPVHGLALLAAIAIDQLRLQPEFLSLALLMWAARPARQPDDAARGEAEGGGTEGSGLLMARCHLIALYVWAGLHKLLSAEYVPSASRFWQRAAPVLDEGVARLLAQGVAVFELGLGLALLWPAARRRAGWVACAMHVVIFLSLSPLGRGRNEAVWPWNLALAVAAPLLLTSWSASWRQQRRASGPVALALALLLLLSPALYYLGRLDAYLSYCLYSVNVPVAVLVRSEQRERLAEQGATQLRLPDLNAELKSLHVPFPPAPRMFEQYFALVGAPGDELHVYDPRPWAARRRPTEYVLSWPPR